MYFGAEELLHGKVTQVHLHSATRTLHQPFDNRADNIRAIIFFIGVVNVASRGKYRSCQERCRNWARACNNATARKRGASEWVGLCSADGDITWRFQTGSGAVNWEECHGVEKTEIEGYCS